MRRIPFVLVVLLLLLGVPTLSGHGGEPKTGDKVHDLMQRKLVASQKALEGIAVNDFDKVGRQADELIAVSKEVEWRVMKTPEYELYSNDFRRAADGLSSAAKDKNMDAAALAYVDLTLTCVKCHKHVRGMRKTSFEP